MRHYVLYNPLAGNGSHESNLKELCASFGEDTQLCDITEIKSYSDFLLALSPDDVLVIAGGDGTLNRFVNDTDGLDIENEVLYLATGSGNDFLRDIDGEDGSRPFRINEYINDLPTVEVAGKTHRFINGVGYGIDGYCCEVGDKQRATSKKPVNYTAIAIKGLLFHFKPRAAVVTVDGVEYKYDKVWIAPTMNGRFYGGGMMTTPKQDRLRHDGKVSLMVFHGTGSLRTLMIFPSIFKGEHVKHTEVVAIHEGSEISVRFDKPTPLQIDGETVLGVTEYKVSAKSRVKV